MSRGCPADVHVLQTIRSEITRIIGEAERSRRRICSPCFSYGSTQGCGSPRLRHECNHRLSSPFRHGRRKDIWPKIPAWLYDNKVSTKQAELLYKMYSPVFDEVTTALTGEDDQLNEAYDYLETETPQTTGALMRSSELYRSHVKNQKISEEENGQVWSTNRWKSTTWSRVMNWVSQASIRRRSLVLRNWSSSIRSIGIYRCSKHLVMMVSWSRERWSRISIRIDLSWSLRDRASCQRSRAFVLQQHLVIYQNKGTQGF